MIATYIAEEYAGQIIRLYYILMTPWGVWLIAAKELHTNTQIHNIKSSCWWQIGCELWSPISKSCTLCP